MYKCRLIPGLRDSTEMVRLMFCCVSIPRPKCSTNLLRHVWRHCDQSGSKCDCWNFFGQLFHDGGLPNGPIFIWETSPSTQDW